MTDNNEEKIIKQPEKDLGQEEGVEDVVELENAPENKAEDHHPPHRQAGKIREEIENTNLDDDVKMQAQSHANDLQSLETKEKIEKLLKTAKEKGVVFAVAVAKKMNDPYILDTFHDTLAQEGLYKEYLK